MDDEATDGVLLINLGTPKALTTKEVRAFLKEFLSDPRVVEASRLIWLPVLYGLILVLRPPRVTRAYQKIWTDKGSPLLVNTLKQRRALNSALARHNSQVIVEAGMCYGQPSIETALNKMQAHTDRIKRLIVLPLYPQYSSTTTAAAFDALAKALRRWRRLPEIHMINDYHKHDAYIKACVARIRKARQQHGTGDKLMLSFHGLPQKNVLKGDPYQAQCLKTANLITYELGLRQDQWLICFQSRFGREAWLTPYTDETLRTLPAQGVRSVDVFCPGFAADCLETLEEMDIQNRDVFLAAGGEQFNYIPALNDSQPHIDCLAQLVNDKLVENDE